METSVPVLCESGRDGPKKKNVKKNREGEGTGPPKEFCTRKLKHSEGGGGYVRPRESNRCQGLVRKGKMCSYHARELGVNGTNRENTRSKRSPNEET